MAKQNNVNPLGPFHNRPDEWELYQPLHGSRMLELGDKINRELTYKAFFESIGFEHISIDWNGLHGAYKRDLRYPLWDEFGQFDMVTNIGTTEHVSHQRGVWENLHMMTVPGGILISVTPYHDGQSWQWHGDYYPTEEFFQQFAELNGWKIERMYTGRVIPHENLYVRMEKTEYKKFTMPDMTLIKINKRRAR